VNAANSSEIQGSFSIGNTRVPNRVILAPMSGITDAPFRRLVQRLGAGLVVSEMTASESLAEGCRNAKLRAEGQGNGIHIVQLAGCEPHWMAEGARIAEAEGADIIDINMGCPAKHVANKQSGSALMRDLDHALELIEATVNAVALPVTLKMRLGWDGSSINAPELARRAQAAGIRMITVHGRTRCQFFTGRADWTAVRAVRDAITIPLVVNGDIRAVGDIDTALKFSGADAIMVGRAAQGRPWLPGQFARYLATGVHEAPPPLSAQLALITALYEEMLAHHGLRIGLRHARKHLGWALDAAAATAGVAFEQLKRWRSTVLTSENPSDARARLAQAYDAFACEAAA
jgi:tRNA-dihydrouridine synthase B